MTMVAAELPVLDRARLAEFTAGDAALEREILELYVRTSEGYLAELAKLPDDPAGWRRSAHALKGASANLGAVELAALAQTAEHSAPDLDLLAPIAQALARVRNACATGKDR